MACCSKICVAEEISVYDPDTDQRFILRAGKMIKEDLEAGNTFSSSPPSTAHVPETDDIDMTDFEEMIFKMVVKVSTACLTSTNVKL